jgi:hypothetical protein
MFTPIYIFTWIAFVSLGAVVSLVGWQVFALRRGWVSEHSHQPLGSMIEPKVDRAAFTLATFVRAFAHFLSLKILVTIRTMLLISKYIITKVEKRFANIISTVKGRGVVTKKGSVSLFLKEIEVARVEVRSEE